MYQQGLPPGAPRPNDTQERDTSLTLEGSSTRLVGRIITDATVYGARAKWRLQLTREFTRRNGTWLASRSEATTW